MPMSVVLFSRLGGRVYKTECLLLVCLYTWPRFRPKRREAESFGAGWVLLKAVSTVRCLRSSLTSSFSVLVANIL